MTPNQLRQKYIDFFVNNYQHTEIKGASVIPENDPTVLFTTAGMQPLIPYLLGEKHPSGNKLVDAQKCIRTGDIDEVGDDSHLTFFEMLGNWSLGSYFKEEAIKMSFQFLTSEQGLNIPLEKLAFTCFAGDQDAPKDEESYNLWLSLGVSKNRIAFLGKEDNWWGPAGATGPCGPDTEMFYWTGDGPAPEIYDPADENWLEIWNDVFMQYNKQADGSFTPLEQKNVDTGMGLERVISVLLNKKSPFETPVFEEQIKKVQELASSHNQKSERIIVDHLRTATFILADPSRLVPSNTDQGYILRRLIRRAIVNANKIGIQDNFTTKIAQIVIKNYGDFYTELKENQAHVLTELEKEENKFKKTLQTGLKTLDKQLKKLPEQDITKLPENFFFEMFATYGFPLEMTIEHLTELSLIKSEQDLQHIKENFKKHFQQHQALSRAGAEQKFAGGLADHSIETTRLHTATHLLHKALKNILGEQVQQKGSNITKERLRFDFNHPEKLTPEQKKAVEDMVNQQIQAQKDVTWQEIPTTEAKAQGAIGYFDEKYGDLVKVYMVGQGENLFSMELCGGPHVQNTKELGRFKIKKEESCGAGVRRIKAILIDE